MMSATISLVFVWAKRISAFLFSFFLALLVLNAVLLSWSPFPSPPHSAWTLDVTDYNWRYINWSRSWCDKDPSLCDSETSEPMKKASAHRVEVYCNGIVADDVLQAEMMQIVFLGDSFTDAPGMGESESFAAVVGKNISEKYQQCASIIRVATGGTGPSQQLAFFTDHLQELQPDLVVWQWYYNDFYENIQRSVHTIRNNDLVYEGGGRNFIFVVGWLNQHVPLLRYSALGENLMSLSDYSDVFHSWKVSIDDPHEFEKFNFTYSHLLLDSMLDLAMKEQFQVVTTIAPLECQFVPEWECPEHIVQYQNDIRQALRKNSNFVSMEENIIATTLSAETSSISGQYAGYFQVEGEKSVPGTRHLSKQGNTYFGLTLAENLGTVIKKFFVE